MNYYHLLSIDNKLINYLSAAEIACILGKPEELIIQLMKEKR